MLVFKGEWITERVSSWDDKRKCVLNRDLICNPEKLYAMKSHNRSRINKKIRKNKKKY